MTSSTSSSSGPKRYPVDVRLFLVSITVGMAISFGVGVFFGPVPSMESLAEFQNRHNNQAVKKDPPKSVKRLPTDHSADLGPKVEADGKPDHQPAGQHLLVDMKNIEAEFLNSEPRLADAMVAAAKAGGLTLLSYHCHALLPAGVSCVGVLLESHISFHTWPDEGVITLDLFTCGDSPLIPVVPSLEKLFGVPRKNETTGEMEKVEVLWSHELRGFRTREDRREHYLDLQSDLALWITSPLDLHYKKEIVSVQSPYQRIDIWDIKDNYDTPSYADGLKHNLKPGDPAWFTHEFASPERLLFLDGTLQSLSHSEREYHEALVHPAMFAHAEPKSVAIVGGGEGATLREVLKHKTVTSAKMIDIDELMVKLAREHLPSMSDCSDMKNSADSCFDDPRAELIIADGRQHFVENYLPAAKKQLYDVIIIDALDPEEENEYNDRLYNDNDFITALFNSLSDDGVMVVQVGTVPNIHDPRADMGVYRRREIMFQLLEAHPSTKVMAVYEEAHCGFNEPHGFLLVCKSYKCREGWYSPTDVIDFQIYERITTTKSGERPLIHYDGSTQHTYKYPPKAWETVYCRREPRPTECDFVGIPKDKLLFEYSDVDEESDFLIKKNDDGSTQVFANDFIPKGSYIMPEHLASSFLISDRSVANLVENSNNKSGGPPVVLQRFVKYIEEHGHPSRTYGSASNIVEIGASFLIRKVDDPKEANVGRLVPSEGDRPVYSPVYDRHRLSFDVFLVALNDIKDKDEITKYVTPWE